MWYDVIWCDMDRCCLNLTVKHVRHIQNGGNRGSPHRNRSWQPVGRNKWSSNEAGVLAKCQEMSMVTTWDDMRRHELLELPVASRAILHVHLVLAPFFLVIHGHSWSFKWQGPKCLQHACNMFATRCKQGRTWDARMAKAPMTLKVDDSQPSNHWEHLGTTAACCMNKEKYRKIIKNQTRIKHESTWNTMVILWFLWFQLRSAMHACGPQQRQKVHWQRRSIGGTSELLEIAGKSG